MHPMLYVVIATSGRAELLERTPGSLAQCDLPSSFSGTIIVENGNERSAERVVRNAPAALRATYLLHPEANKSAALNAALRELDDSLIVFLDDDVVVAKKLLCAYAAAAQGLAKAWSSAVRCSPTTKSVLRPSWLVDYHSLQEVGGSTRAAKTSAVRASLVSTGSRSARDLRAVGLDPSFGPGSVTGSVGQEREMQQRLLAAGLHGRYVRDAEVWHWVPKERCTAR
jgi:hypothetical protein